MGPLIIMTSTKVNYYEMNENDFKNEFFTTMDKLAKNTNGKLETYIVHGFENETNWCGTGINIRTIEIKANNEYDFWLKLDDFFESKQSHYEIFNYDWFMEMLSEEIEDENESIQYDMIEIINYILDTFKNSDTFWFSKFTPN